MKEIKIPCRNFKPIREEYIEGSGNKVHCLDDMPPPSIKMRAFGPQRLIMSVDGREILFQTPGIWNAIVSLDKERG